MIDKAAARREKRQRQEQEAAQRLTNALQAFGCSNVTDQAVQERIAGFFNYLHADWFNASDQEQADDMTERLAKLGVTVSIAHYTGDSSYPTEYTIRHPQATGTGTGPTFDLALTEFIEHLLEGKK